MRKHVMELHVQDGRPFQCPVPSCGVKFARLRYLRRHQNLSHRTPPTCTSPTADDHAWNNSAGTAVGEVHVDSAALQNAEPRGNERPYTALETLSLFAVAAARKNDLVGDAPE